MARYWHSFHKTILVNLDSCQESNLLTNAVNYTGNPVSWYITIMLKVKMNNRGHIFIYFIILQFWLVFLRMSCLYPAIVILRKNILKVFWAFVWNLGNNRNRTARYKLAISRKVRYVRYKVKILRKKVRIIRCKLRIQEKVIITRNKLMKDLFKDALNNEDITKSLCKNITNMK